MNGKPEFTGLENFKRLVTDSDFHKAVGVTLKYIILLVPLKLIVSLGTALLLNMNITKTSSIMKVPKNIQ